MHNIQQQLNLLQTTVNRQRFFNIALLGVIVIGALIAAVRPVGETTFDSIVCKVWKIVDNDGKPRIVAGTHDGDASIILLDKNGKVRIGSTIFAAGEAEINWFDKEGKERIRAGTLPDGQASVQWFDKDEKKRVIVGTLPNGQASTFWFDKEEETRIGIKTLPNGDAGMSFGDKLGKSRILVGTFADGSVSLPTQDLTPPKKP